MSQSALASLSTYNFFKTLIRKQKSIGPEVQEDAPLDRQPESTGKSIASADAQV